MAPYVKHITFVPPLHASFDFEEYKKVLSKHHIRRTKRQLRRGFAEYEASYDKTWSAFDCEELRVQWSTMLKQCTKATSFSFALVDYSIMGADLQPAKPDCFVLPIRDPHRIQLRCDDGLAAHEANDSVRVAIDCISRAQRVIETLEFGQASMHIDYGWDKALSWDRLDLSQLKNLSVQPRLPNYCRDEDSYKMGQLMQKDIHVLFNRSSATLESFICHRASGLLWEGTPIVLAKLRYLELGLCVTSSKFFCAWLEALPRLEPLVIAYEMRLVFKNSHREEPSNNWRKVFDAMGDHRTLIEANVKFSTGIDGYDYKFYYHKDAHPRLYKGITESMMKMIMEKWLEQHHPGDANKWIPYYIRKNIEWCGVLEEDFGDTMGAAESSDEWTSDSGDEVASEDDDTGEDIHGSEHESD